MEFCFQNVKYLAQTHGLSQASTDSDADYHGYSERTLAIIKPEAYDDAEAIENHIINNGFQILAVSDYYSVNFIQHSNGQLQNLHS